jgi:lipoprotein-releasing system ATP-binding protein
MSSAALHHDVLIADRLGKTYESGPARTEVLADVTFSVSPGESVAIIGASGSGKSTLLHLLGGLDTPSTGSVTLMGQSLALMSDAARGDLRNQALGFVYQFHHLLAELTAVQNVALALRIRRTPTAQADAKARDLLESVGLGHRLQHLPSELSGGERQRVAIARALVTEPACVLADEPTGNLDAENGDRVFALLCEATRSRKASLVLVTHDRRLAARCDRILQLTQGRLQQSAEIQPPLAIAGIGLVT